MILAGPRVVRFDFWIDPVFDRSLLEVPGVAVDVAPAQGDDAAAWRALQGAHVYLFEALSSGHLAGAGLDVRDPEPPPLDHPLLTLPSVVATCHTAGVSHEARRQVARMAAEQIAGLLHGRRPPRLVNPQAWEHVLQRTAAANRC